MPSTDQSCVRPTGKWLSVVGMGECGVRGLGDNAKELISSASTVFGGSRHLSLAGPLITGDAEPWPKPFDTAMKTVLSLRGSPVCVLASGDPFWNGVGVTLARHIAPDEMQIIPHASAFSLAAARLGWALQDTDTVSLHGRDVELIRPLLQSGRRVLALTSDEHGPAAVAKLLRESGGGSSKFYVLEALGGDYEKITATTANDFHLPAANPLNLVALLVDLEKAEAAIPLTPGMNDDRFQHDGQITKREIRALTLSALAPRRGELLWDIGAGAGSVAIEWMLRHDSMRAIAIERDAKRAGRIEVNARNLGVPNIDVVTGTAPKVLPGLQAPDAIFIGGGGSDDGVAHKAIESLKSGGRMVANAVTLEMEAALFSLHAKFGGDLVRLSVSRASPIGSMTGWRPAMPVTQWIWTKP